MTSTLSNRKFQFIFFVHSNAVLLPATSETDEHNKPLPKETNLYHYHKTQQVRNRMIRRETFLAESTTYDF